MFPEMPDEVFNIFLKPLIDTYGWQFTSVGDSTIGTDWFRILHSFDLSTIQQLRWVRHSFFLDKYALSPISQGDTDRIILNKRMDSFALFGAHSESSRETLTKYVKAMKNTGCFPTPVTMVISTQRFHIFDGNHRISALFYLGLNRTIKVDAWIGEIPTEQFNELDTL